MKQWYRNPIKTMAIRKVDGTKRKISFSDLYGMARPCATELRQEKGVLENLRDFHPPPHWPNRTEITIDYEHN
jgi:hypothetical protein